MSTKSGAAAKTLLQQESAHQPGRKNHGGKRLGMLDKMAQSRVQFGSGVGLDAENQGGQKKQSGQKRTLPNYVTGPKMQIRHTNPPFDKKLSENRLGGKRECIHLLEGTVIFFDKK